MVVYSLQVQQVPKRDTENFENTILYSIVNAKRIFGDISTIFYLQCVAVLSLHAVQL